MNLRIAKLVFIKDGLELLRDRRTLFVNIVLPVLLYPVLALVAVQLRGLAEPGPEDWPRIALIDAPADLVEDLPLVPVDATELPEGLDHRGPLTAPTIADSFLATIRTAAEELPPPALADDSPNDPGESVPAISEETNAAIAELLRTEQLAAAIVALGAGGDASESGDGERLVLLFDGAHRRFDVAKGIIDEALERREERLLAQRLEERQLPAEVLTVQKIDRHQVATTSEALRVRFAAFIPFLLVVLAVSGALMPAIDLLAGERERGTLETLLSWPGGRSAIFLGKLAVVVAAALTTVILNLASLGLTVGIVTSAGSLGGDITSGLVLDVPTLLVCLLGILPITIAIAAGALGIAGLAASTKEAQNYLGPFFLVTAMPALIAMAPTLGPSLALDLVPVVGPVLVLKSVIQGDPVPWMHLTVSLLASATVAAVVISWCAKLLDSERFLFPQLAAAGWGRFRKWGEPDASPDGVGALAVFAVSLAVFMGAGIILVAAPLMAQVALPLIAIGLVPVAATWLMGHRPGIALGTAAPRSKAMVAALLMSPLALALSLSLGALQSLAMPPQTPEQLERLIQTLQALEAQAGIFGLLLVAAVLPGLCEELLFRGFILRGLTASLGARTGVILSSLLFALLHMSPWRFLPQFALGVALAVLTLRTGSVWPAVFVHFAHNATVLLIGDDDTSAPADNQVDTSIGAIAGTVAVAILAVVGMVFVLRAAACRRDSAR